MPDYNTAASNLSFPQFLLRNALEEKSKNKVAIMDGTTGEELTYTELYRRTYSLASHLKGKLGIKPNDCIAILSPNSIHYLPCFLGIGLTGACSTTINPLYSPEEIEYQLEITQARAIFTSQGNLEKVLPIARKMGNIPVVSLGKQPASTSEGVIDIESFLTTPLAAIDRSLVDGQYPSIHPDSIMTIPFSSGTTGKPKGVMLTHRNLISNVLQTMPQEGKYLLPSEKHPNGGTLIIPLPFFHIFGMVAGMCVPIYAKAKMIFLQAFDLQLFLELIQRHRVNRGHVVPPIILGLAKHPMVSGYDLSSLESLMSGAAPLGGEVQKACAERIPGCIVKQAWGMTELSPAAAITPDDRVTSIDFIKGKAGMLTPATEGKIVDPVTGKDLPFTEEGELLIRGPQVMKGYFKNDAATKATLRDDGWLHTGDIGYFDKEGWLYITDRSKELIKYKGFQVAPAELEAVIGSMPEVKDVIVIPILDEEAGELPRAYVVKQDTPLSSQLKAEDVERFVSGKVAPHKRLRGGVIFCEKIPKSPSGKLLRRVQIQVDRGIIKSF